MPTEPHRLSAAARGVAVYLDAELSPFIQDPLVRDRISDRWAKELDDQGLLADIRPRRRRAPWAKVMLRLFSR